jgi:CheY-like chemotaxis protein
LASAYGIVHNHGGSIICRSEENKGTSFFIYLPKSDKMPVPEGVQESIINQDTQANSETILLVDDEEMVTAVGQEMLEYLGYKVIVALSGQKAISIVKDRGEEINLVILDMIMPEMGGAETFEVLHKMHPQLPVLLCSGYSLDGKASEIMARGCDGFIQKPFDLDILSQRLRDILEAPATNPNKL